MGIRTIEVAVVHLQIVVVSTNEAAEVAEYALEPHEYDPVVNALRKNPKAWLDFMMVHELFVERCCGVFRFATVAAYFNNMVVWPLYCFAEVGMEAFLMMQNATVLLVIFFILP
ncbi:hypothetical protein L1987_23903 [Smallanthus sonchifolius]|uniref:Uncharacterized protein n=1 Tax=Smallanthus sonchifolius TaxID=185202 RepID=A0ACB9IJ63_9ASTR|nr:hypothetical protein L1987_23903 [Smallanthus sonchifolius]